MRPRPSDPFFALVQKARDSSGEINLARGALLIAQQTYPDLNIEHYLRQLDALSEDFRTRYVATDSLPTSLANLSQYVFGDAPDASTIEHNIRVLANRLIPLN